MSENLKIYFDAPYSRAYVFAPGDQVSGKVVFDPKEDENVENIHVEFRGKYETRVGGGKETRSFEITMFSMQKILFQGPFKMRASTYEYPFSFQFPKTFRFNPTVFHDDRLFPNEHGDGLQPLPPSCNDSGSHFSGNYRIFYRITARIPRTFGDWESEIFLRFAPYRLELNPVPHPASSKDEGKLQRRYRLTDEGIPRPLTSNETFKEKFHRHAVNHTISFSLSASVPTAIVIGRPYAVEITLLSTDVESGHSAPEFQFSNYWLILKGRTIIRAPGILSATTSSLQEDITLGHGSIKCRLPLNKPLVVNGMFPSNPSYIPPNFSSFAMQKSYGLELKGTVSCLGEDSEFKIHWPRVTLYPARMEDGIEDAMKSIESGARDMGLDDQSGLPAYEK
ncbi:hypothetical protein OIDMADRAFT_183026 [Oidiodendron maius Zn]|uniref:Arrestin-like N-terminal domain-containing protein n=1 Tax=Oidiodendron maius (strain Zn) TaxID=913774 RepID=A0A0C3GLG2_OIDMZ|nr:hypothetical protein OIDMADRAFT_183026 [Oidiodendron maius Zn]